MAKLAIAGGQPVVKCLRVKWPQINQTEERLIMEVVKSRKWFMHSYRPETLSKVGRFEKQFARFLNVKKCVAVNSGSSALEICVSALGIGPGDEVITTPYTFFATVSCILNHYAFPVFVDIDPETYQIDSKKIEAAITKRTKAIIPVHFAGNMPDMNSIMKIAKKYKLKVIEDAAQAHGSSYKDGRNAGSIGDMGIFSFQQSKNLTSGEGGIITTNDDDLADLAWSLRDYGRLKDVAAGWHQHYILGWNLRMSEFHAAILIAQLKRLRKQTEKRMKNYKYLTELLYDLPGIKLMKLNPEQKNFAHHLIVFRYIEEQWKNIPLETFLRALSAEGVPGNTGYPVPLYRQPVFKNLDFSSPSPFMKGRKSPIDYNRFTQICQNAECACAGRTFWLPGILLLENRKNIEAIADAFWKLRENLYQLSTSFHRA